MKNFTQKHPLLSGALIGVLVVWLVVGGGLSYVESMTTPRAQAATILAATNESLEVVTSSTSAVDVTVSYIEYTSTTATPAAEVDAITTATVTTILPAPGAASTQRQVKRINAHNKGAASNTLTLQKDIGGTNYELFTAVLGPDESLTVDSEGEYHVYGSDGLEKIPATTVIDGRTLSFLKVGATSEAAGLLQVQLKDTGVPGAWVPGTPGVNGDAVSCNTTGDATIAGAPYLPDPASGNYYLTAATAGVSVACMPFLLDWIWYNTGLVVTTTTAQSITMPTMPARDTAGTTNGEGWYAGVLVTTATTNAGAVTNMTISYTDSDGNAGNTGTVSSFPATAVAGAFIPIHLAAGDRGIRTIESITLGTSLVTGAVSLVVYRPLVYMPSPVANVGGTISVVNAAPSGAKLWNGTCLASGYLASATTATTMALNAQLTVR